LSSFAIQIDATALFYRHFIVPQSAPGWLDARQVQSIQLAPGTYAIQVQSGVYTDVGFTVTAQGTVDYDASLNALLSGRGSSSLTLLGLTVTIDAQGLSSTSGVLLASIPLTNDDWISLRTLRLLPQTGYLVQQGSGVVCDLTFTLGRDGTFSYDPVADVARGGCLAGAGTSTLTLRGFAVTVDVAAVSALLGLVEIWGLPPTFSGKRSIVVLPAAGFRFQLDQGITEPAFSVGPHGDVSLAPSPSNLRLALDAQVAPPVIRALPVALPPPGPLVFATYDFGRFRIVIGSDAAGVERVSMTTASATAWLVDRRWFPAGATFAVKATGIVRPVHAAGTGQPLGHGMLQVVLAGARWPGTDIAADFSLVVAKGITTDGVDIAVTVTWTFGAGQFDSDETYDGTATASVTVGGSVCKFGKTQLLTINNSTSAQATFRPGRLQLSAAALGSVSGGGADLACNGLDLGVMGPDERSLFTGAAGPPLHSRLLLSATGPWHVAAPAAETPIGTLSAQADLFDTLNAEVGENLDGRRRQAILYTTRSNSPQFSLALGPGIADAFGKPLVLALVRCALSINFDGDPPHVELRTLASAGTAWARTNGIGVLLHDTLDQTLPNFGLAFDGPAVIVLQCDLAYAGIAVPLDGCNVEPTPRGGRLSILAPGSQPDATRLRNWLVLGTTPVGVAPLSLRDFAFSVLRTADLLWLRFEFRDLLLRARTGSAPRLGTAIAGQGGFMVVSFPPQHIAEQVFPDGQAPAPAQAASMRMGGESHLAFAVPGDGAGVALTLDALLSWARLALSVESICDDPPPRIAPLAPAGLNDAGPPQTGIELPYRLVLSPGTAAGFSHAAAPITHGRWTELWHTRLGARKPTPALPGGFVVDERKSPANDEQRRMRAIWSYDYSASPATRETRFMTSLLAADRRDIVDADANFANKVGVPAKLGVARLALSALGGWINTQGSWQSDPPDRQNSFAAWTHVVAQGRDQFVRVVHRGSLFPFGHRAAVATISERVFYGGERNSAALRKYLLLQPLDPIVDYPPTPGVIFARVEITTETTPTLALPPADVPLNQFPSRAAFWIALSPGDPVQPFLFQLRAWDRLGNVSEFGAAMIFVDDTAQADKAVMDAVAAAYDQARTADGSRAARSSLTGQKLAFAPERKPGDTTLEAHALTFWSGQPPAAPTAAGTPVAFVPRLQTAEVHLPAARALSSSTDQLAQAVEIAFEPGYLARGFDPGNPAEVYATLTKAIPIGFKGDKSLGVASPDMTIGALSRQLGTVPDTWKNVFPSAGAAPDLGHFFPDSATLMGGIKLKDLVQSFAPPSLSGPNAAGVPVMKTDTSDPREIVTTLDWQPAIPAGAHFDAGVLRLRFNAGAPSVFELHSRSVVPLTLPGAAGPPATPQSLTTGRLTRLDLAFVPTGNDALATVHFAEFSFTAQPGTKPDVRLSFGPNPISLGGQLDFLQVLMDKLSGILGGGPSVKIDGGTIVAGYAIAIPQLSIGIFSLQNIGVGVAVTIPLAGDAKVQFRFNFAEQSHPFNLTIGLLGGGGYFALAVDATGVDAIDLAVEAGAAVAFDLAGLASGSAHVVVGVSFHYSPQTLMIGGYLRAGAELTVLQVLSLHVEFYAGLTYIVERRVIQGSVSVMVEVTVGFLHTSVTLEMTREFAVGGGRGQADPRRLAAATGATAAIKVADLMSAADWETYAGAFAPAG